MKISIREIAFIAVFAALYVIVALLPGIPVIGFPEAKIDLSAVLGPIFGLVLGPYLGALAAFIGALLGWALPPGVPGYFGLFTIACPTISAFVAGMLTRRSFHVGKIVLGGWILAFIVLLSLIVCWYLTWVGLGAPFYPILHFGALAIILVSRGKLAEFYATNLKGKLTLAVALSGYCGIMADHMLGNLIFIATIGWFIPLEAVQAWLDALGLPTISALFMYALPISAVERVVMTIIITLVGTSLVLALRAANLIQRPEVKK